MSSIIKGLTTDEAANNNPNINVPGFGTVPLDQLKRHIQKLSAEFDSWIQAGDFMKAAYHSEQFFNALFALARAEKEMEKNRTINEREPQSPGGMGQSYRKFVAKPAGLEETAIPMFTPEEKIQEEAGDLKINALKIMYDAIMIPLKNSLLYPTNEDDFKRLATVTIQDIFKKRYPHLTRQQLGPASQKMADDMFTYFFSKEMKPQEFKKASGADMRESSILKGLSFTK